MIKIAFRFYDNETALQHSLGNLDVNTGTKVNDFDPNNWKVSVTRLSCSEYE